MMKDEDCRTCYGRGSNYGQFCPDCNGTGLRATRQGWGVLLLLATGVSTVATVLWLLGKF